jgi:hypothetical protein
LRPISLSKRSSEAQSWGTAEVFGQDSAFAIGFAVEAVAGSEAVVVFDTPSGRQPIKIRVTDANVTSLRIVATP